MDEVPPTAPAGWYPSPNGGQRYWDGGSWLSISPPPEIPPAEPLLESPKSAPTKRSTRGWIVMAVAILALAGVVAGAYAVKNARDATAVAVIAEQSQKARDDQATTAKALADAAEADEAQKVQDAADAQAAKDKVERLVRKESVSEIEKSVKKMAKENVKDDVIEGPIIDVSCDPVAGGSVDDLSEKTTVFQCFVANKKNKDETMSGYYYNATMNWKSGSYTYGYGKP